MNKPKMIPKPPHPLVVDSITGLCRYATQADIHRLEAICSAHKAMIANARERLAAWDKLMDQLMQEYGQ